MGRGNGNRQRDIVTAVHRFGRSVLKGASRQDTAQLRRAAKRLAARGKVRVVQDRETGEVVAVPVGSA